MICGRDTEAGSKVAEELTAAGPGECVFERCDVGKPDQIHALIDHAIERSDSTSVKPLA